MQHVFTILDNDDPPVAYFYELDPSNATANTETQTVKEQDAAEGTAGYRECRVSCIYSERWRHLCEDGPVPCTYLGGRK